MTWVRASASLHAGDISGCLYTKPGVQNMSECVYGTDIRLPGEKKYGGGEGEKVNLNMPLLSFLRFTL